MTKVACIGAEYFVFFSQVAMVLYGASFLVLVPFILSPIEQGFWFTMLSLGAMSRLADMGFMSLLLTHIGYTRSKSFKYSFNDVYTFTKLWRNKVIKIIFPIIFLLGTLILITFKLVGLQILLSWLLYVTALSVLFYSVYKITFIEGMGLVRQAHFFRGMIYFLATIFTTVFLLVSPGVYALGGGLLASLTVNLIAISYYFNGLVLIDKSDKNDTLELQKNFVDLLKKTAGSWTGGYIGMHGIIPIIYVLSGPVISGMAGVTLNIFLAIQNFSNSFMVARVPDVTYLIAKRKYISAKVILRSSFFKTFLTFVLLCFIVWGAYYLCFEIYFTDRLLDGSHLMYLFTGFLFQIFISAIAIYIRAHKKELFAYMSIVTSLIGIIILFVAVKLFDKEWYFLGFFVSSFIALLWALKLLQTEKRYIE